jgi:ketosteroid isomerase-like protein
MFKKVFFLSLIISTLAFGAFAQKGAAAAAKGDPAKDVRAAFDRLVDGIRQSDATKVMSVYDKSERTLFFNNNGSITMGWENMRANRVSSYAKTKNVTLDVEGVRVEVLGPSAAYVSCTWIQNQEYDDKLEKASGRMTLIFKKVGSEWKVIHLHTSPNNPDTTRPVFPSDRLPMTDKPE